MTLSRDKRLVGIVSLGDLAVETGDEHLARSTLEAEEFPVCDTGQADGKKKGQKVSGRMHSPPQAVLTIGHSNRPLEAEALPALLGLERGEA